MKTYLFFIPFLLLSCSSANKTEDKIYDYDDVDTHISWSDIFIQEEENYSVYFYSKTCSHCLEIKQDFLQYYFTNKEKIYLVESNEDTKIGPVSDITGVNSNDSFYIFGTPFLINLKNHAISKYYGGTKQILEYIENQSNKKL